VLGLLTSWVLCTAGVTPALAQDVASFEKRTTVKVLPNGLTLLVIERPVSPVFSFYTRIDVGAVQEPVGQTGLAHMFEHMAFKGTDRIGTKDIVKERGLLDKVEKAYLAFDAERRKSYGRDEAKVKQLDEAWKKSHRRRRGSRETERVRRACRSRRRCRTQRLDQLGSHRLLLLDARQPRRALGLPGVRAHEAPDHAPVLQRARCRQ
jgi:hypothetical protein